MARIKERVNELSNKTMVFFVSSEYRNLYILIGAIFTVSYIFIWNLMTDLGAFSYVKTSPLTANMFILLFLWGWYADKKWKAAPKMKKNMIMYGGSILIIVLLRIGGIKTIFG